MVTKNKDGHLVNQFATTRGVGGCITRTIEAMSTLGMVTTLDDAATYRILTDVTHLHQQTQMRSLTSYMIPLESAQILRKALVADL